MSEVSQTIKQKLCRENVRETHEDNLNKSNRQLRLSCFIIDQTYLHYITAIPLYANGLNEEMPFGGIPIKYKVAKGFIPQSSVLQVLF